MRPAPEDAEGPVRPLILVRGFGGLDVRDEQADAYQGFNDGTVYPHRKGENYIYEGFVLRALKSGRYRDATNVVGYYPKASSALPPVTTPQESHGWTKEQTQGAIAVDVATARQVIHQAGVSGTLWVYRYYDLLPRTLGRYGEGLAQLIRIIRHGWELVERSGNEGFPGVDIVAHSMGGLVLHSALRSLKNDGDQPKECIHRIVTLGTPHRGISFQFVPKWLLRMLPQVERAADEIAAFDPRSRAFLNIPQWFPIERILTVVGTDYRSYGAKGASLANRLANLVDNESMATNRSDGLVGQSAAQLPGAPRTFVHKCHGGRNSLVTSREAFEIAMRFFHGTHKVQLWLDSAEVMRERDVFGKSEFFFGVSVKPRYVDFELFHQSAEAENCYGPFDTDRNGEFVRGPTTLEKALSKELSAPGDPATGWPRVERPNRRLIWEGWVDRSAKPAGQAADRSMVFRLDIYVGERDSLGIGFSDNVVFRKQYYLQVLDDGRQSAYVHTGEKLLRLNTRGELDAVAGPAPGADVQAARKEADGWSFRIGGTGFSATLRIAVFAERRG